MEREKGLMSAPMWSSVRDDVSPTASSLDDAILKRVASLRIGGWAHDQDIARRVARDVGGDTALE